MYLPPVHAPPLPPAQARAYRPQELDDKLKKLKEKKVARARSGKEKDSSRSLRSGPSNVILATEDYSDSYR